MRKFKILSAIVFLFCFFCSCRDNREKEKLGEEISVKIENYKTLNGRLPKDLSEIGVVEKMEGPIYYAKKNDTTYILYYGGDLGESIIYNSKTKKWESDHQ